MRSLHLSASCCPETMNEARKKRNVMLATVISLILSTLFQLLSVIIYPPDFSLDYPSYSPDGVLLLEFGGALLLLGLTIIGMKAEEEKETLAAAGFTAAAISMGVSMAGLFEITHVNSAESYEKFYYITVSSNFLLFPALILIASYQRFKNWIRMAGFAVSLPLLLSTILFIAGYRDYKNLELISNSGYFLLMLVCLLWAYNVYINYKEDSGKRSPG